MAVIASKRPKFDCSIGEECHEPMIINPDDVASELSVFDEDELDELEEDEHTTVEFWSEQNGSLKKVLIGEVKISCDFGRDEDDKDAKDSDDIEVVEKVGDSEEPATAKPNFIEKETLLNWKER